MTVEDGTPLRGEGSETINADSFDVGTNEIDESRIQRERIAEEDGLGGVIPYQGLHWDGKPSIVYKYGNIERSELCTLD